MILKILKVSTVLALGLIAGRMMNQPSTSEYGDAMLVRTRGRRCQPSCSPCNACFPPPSPNVPPREQTVPDRRGGQQERRGENQQQRRGGQIPERQDSIPTGTRGSGNR